MEDARTTGRWYLGVTMGRPTGHLTLGIGKAASATCTIIPEEFREGTISLSEIVDIVEGSIVKRRAMGKAHGVVLLAEALVERFSPREVAELQDVDRDAQGNIRVTEIDLGRKVKNEVQMRLEPRGIRSPWWTRRSATSCAARRPSPSTPSTRATSATPPSSISLRAATRCWSPFRAATCIPCPSPRCSTGRAGRDGGARWT
jgi:hypothetical protein